MFINSSSYIKNKLGLQCPICLVNYNQTDRFPMIICPSQHSICKLCANQILFKTQNSALCPFDRKIIYKQNLIQFRFLNEIRITSDQLRRQGSKLKNELIKTKQQLLNALNDEKQKNKWLIMQAQQKEQALQTAMNQLQYEKQKKSKSKCNNNCFLKIQQYQSKLLQSANQIHTFKVTQTQLNLQIEKLLTVIKSQENINNGLNNQNFRKINNKKEKHLYKQNNHNYFDKQFNEVRPPAGQKFKIVTNEQNLLRQAKSLDIKKKQSNQIKEVNEQYEKLNQQVNKLMSAAKKIRLQIQMLSIIKKNHPNIDKFSKQLKEINHKITINKIKIRQYLLQLNK